MELIKYIAYEAQSSHITTVSRQGILLEQQHLFSSKMTRKWLIVNMNKKQSKFQTHAIVSPFPSAECIDMDSAGESGVGGAGIAFLFPLELDQRVRQTEKAERAVKANQRRRAPNPGGAVHNILNLLRKPRKSNPVHRGRHDQPMTKPIMTASQIGTAHSKMSTNVSAIEGFFRNSTRSKKVSSIFVSTEPENETNPKRLELHSKCVLRLVPQKLNSTSFCPLRDRFT